jgi:hypothetical protein
MRAVNFLGHGAHQARKLRQLALEKSLAKIHVGQDAVNGVCRRMVRSLGKKSGGDFAPVVGRGNRQLFLGAEVMKEAPLGEPGRFADVLNAGRGIALGADHGERRLKEPGL